MNRTHEGRSVKSFALGLLLMFAIGASSLGALPAFATVDRSKPILFVHGYDFWGGAGSDCDATWADMVKTLQSWGWTSKLILRLSYYYGDTHCDHNIDQHGSHDKHQPGGHRANSSGVMSHTQDAPIEHLAYHLAWTIYDHFTKNGQSVELVGHSMGGLIIREMLLAYQLKDPDYPPKLLVQDVVTLGTPHAGTSLANACPTVECKQMRPSSSSMSWWSQKAQNPQGYGGTDWTIIGAYDDEVVSEDSAVSMSVPHRIKYSVPKIKHGDYMHQTSDSRDSVLYLSSNSGSWQELTKRPRPVRLSDWALCQSSW